MPKVKTTKKLASQAVAKATRPKQKGRLIVIDGIDGSGKATQVKMLGQRLRQEGVQVKVIDFPRYYENFFGELLGEYLAGAFGDFTQTDPRVASVLYAADRFESSAVIKKWLEQGYTVVADRYVSANQIHQGGKIHDVAEREKFMKWLDKMEHGVFAIPRPDLVLYLDVPFEVSMKRLQEKMLINLKKKYLKGRKDIVEENTHYLKNSRAAARSLSEQGKNWIRIDCCDGMVCMLPDQVHEIIYEKVRKIIK